MSFEMSMESALFKAVESGQLEAVRYLLDAGMSPDMMNSFTRCTVMATATKRGHVQVAQLARAYGAELAAFYESAPAGCEASDELLQWADPDVHEDFPGGNRRTGGSRAMLEWLQSRPPADRSMAPPVSEPLGSSRCEQLREMVEKWARLKETEAQEEDEPEEDYVDTVKRMAAQRHGQ